MSPGGHPAYPPIPYQFSERRFIIGSVEKAGECVLDKKDPIPFQSRKRQRAQRKVPPRKGAVKPRSSSVRPVGPRGGETDDVRDYWHRFLRHPLSGPGRLLWTERMLWGNALLAALLTTAGIVVEFGFRFLTIISVFINAFFLFFLAYYMFPWVVDWIFHRQHVHASTVDGLKVEMIVLSGWLVIASLAHLVPFYAPLPYSAALLACGILALFAVHRRVRASWVKTALATAGGALSVAVVMAILSSF